MEKLITSENFSEIQVQYTPSTKAKEKVKITSAQEAMELFRKIWKEETIELHESMYILFLNRANYIIGWYNLSKGGMSGTVCDPRLVFGIALKCAAISIIIAHNHPSGNDQPSASDIQLTKNLVESGKLLEILVLDHLIITTDKFYSFAEEGLI
ncbi:MAG: hypothetical protein RL641_253 [Candidatus Parcubacteria bacterium]|jgi:DNA repair protein RadC